MTFYELISEINSSRQDGQLDVWPYSFNESNRAKLQEAFDLEVFDVFSKAYEITIIYRFDQREGNEKEEYWKYGGTELVPYTDTELTTLSILDWTRLPRSLKAQIFDTIWLCNHKYEAAKIAAEEYYELYHEWFDEVNWVPCINYLSRAIELVAKVGSNDKKEGYLSEVYNDIVRLDGNDVSFLSISLIELLINQKYHCDFNAIIPLVNKMISKNEGSMSTAHILEQAYYVKAHIYKKQKNTELESTVYVRYADTLVQTAEKLVNDSDEENSIDNRNWFMAENNVKKAIELYRNHGASEKSVNAQKRLIEIQKLAFKRMTMREFKYDISELYNKFSAEYEDHDVHELIWDVVFSFGFQDKQRIHEEVTNSEFSISSMFPMQILGSEGQTEFLLPSLQLNDENNVLLHMYHKARENESIQGQTVGVWFIQRFRKLDLQVVDLDLIFENNPIIPNGQEKDVQRGVFYGLTGRMSDALDKLAPKVENMIRNLAEMCGDLMTHYDSKEGIQQKNVLSRVFVGEKLNECVDENILFTFDGLLQQKAGSNIRNRIGHGLSTEVECATGDCIYFVMIVLKFCAMYSRSFMGEAARRRNGGPQSLTDEK